MSNLGIRLKLARKAADLTQKQLAKKIEVSNTSISNWENGVSYPDPDTIQHLCWALNVEPNFLFVNHTNELVDDDSCHCHSADYCSDPDNPGPVLKRVKRSHQIPFSETLTDEEKDMICRFRELDSRGQRVILALLDHEYENIDDNHTESYYEGYEDGVANALKDLDRMPQDWDDC